MKVRYILNYLTILALLSSCDKIKDQLPIKDESPGLNKELFKNRIDSVFGPNVVGYGWAAYKDGALLMADGGGWSRANAIDVSPAEYTPYTVSTIFSTSKTITAAATINLLASKNKTLSEKLVDNLPKRWVTKNSLNGITLLDLLSHKSGLNGTFDGYNAMRDQMAVGMNGTYGQFDYANINFTLFRVIIPYLLEKDEVDDAVGGHTGGAIDKIASLYESYVKEGMNTMNVPDYNKINTDYWAGKSRTLYYNFNNYTPNDAASEKGQEMFDCHDISGAGGWFMTPVQYAHFIDRLMNEKYVIKKDLDVMKNEELGIFDHPGANGIYYWHNGGASWGNSSQGGGCIWMHFPVNNMSFFIQWNSTAIPSPLPDFERDLIADIFDQCYVTP